MRYPASGSLQATTSVAFGLLALAPLLTFAQAAATDAEIQTKPIETHPSQGQVRTIDGAEATLVTTADGVFAHFDTRELTPNRVYTLWLVVINEPTACETSPCSPPDVLERTERTRSDVIYGDGVIATSRRDRLVAFQPVGKAPNGWFGYGLQSPETAEVHLILNDHGQLVPGMAPTMVNTYRGGCTDASIPAAFPATARADGEAGPNACRLIQDVIFEPIGAEGS
jgi:hypothetical protein